MSVKHPIRFVITYAIKEQLKDIIRCEIGLCQKLEDRPLETSNNNLNSGMLSITTKNSNWHPPLMPPDSLFESLKTSQEKGTD